MFSPFYRVYVLFAGRFSTRRDQVGANLRFTLTMEGPSQRDAIVESAAQRSIIHRASSGTTSVPLRISVRFSTRKDLLVRSAAQRWIIHSASSGVTGTPLRAGTINVRLHFARRGHLTDKYYSHTVIPGRSQPICDTARMVLIRSTAERGRHPFFASARVHEVSRVSTPLPW